jgi:hypothetical protein
MREVLFSFFGLFFSPVLGLVVQRLFDIRSTGAGYPRTSSGEVPRDSVMDTGPGDPGRIGISFSVFGIAILGILE